MFPLGLDDLCLWLGSICRFCCLCCVCVCFVFDLVIWLIVFCLCLALRLVCAIRSGLGLLGVL